MKLLFCNKCSDVFKLDDEERRCLCGRCGGRYIDELNAIYWGTAVPLGFHNSSLLTSISQRPEKGLGKEFIAFVIPNKCSTLRKTDEGE